MRNKKHNGFCISYSPAYTLAEILVTLMVISGIILLAFRVVSGDKQSTFDAKFNKVASIITSNLQGDVLKKTGFKYGDYTSDSHACIEAILKNMKFEQCFYDD
ncbi:type II secretion system protein, partial [bacterium]|nr:type II secretion system protein [bacterium]